MQERTPPVTADSSRLRAGERGPLLAVRGVSKSYRRRPVLREVSLQVHAGEVAAVTGQNGAGKTTLLRIHDGPPPPHQPPSARPAPPAAAAAVSGAGTEPASYG